MEQLRLLHFADVHLGVEAGGRMNPSTGRNQRIDDVCDRLDELCAVAEQQSVHAVLFAGDAFNNQHPNPTLQSLFAARVRRLARGGAAVFLLVGNHDLPKRAGLAHPFSIYNALEVPSVEVGDRAGIYRLRLRSGSPAPELQVGALPHFSRHEFLARHPNVDDPDALIADELARAVGKLGSEVNGSLPAVFIGHCHVNQAEVGESQKAMFGISEVEVPLSTLVSDSAFAYYGLGHVHRRQILATEPFVAYCGSLERVDFGEGDRVDVPAPGNVERKDAEPKGFFRFDLASTGDRWQLAGDPTFHNVHARAFVTIRVGALDAGDPRADLARRLSRLAESGVDLAGAFVRIMGTIEQADRTRLSAAVARELVPEADDVRLVLEIQDESRVRDPRFAKRMTEFEALERYVETREDWVDDRDELLSTGRALIAEVLTST